MVRDKPLLVVGHKNPDTDSICSAICYARYKRSVAGERAIACRAGSINRQTRHALATFGADDPQLLADVLPRLSDIMIAREALYLLHSDQPLCEAYRIMTDNRFSFLPVVDESGRCTGKVTALGIASLLSRLDEPEVEPEKANLAAFTRLCGADLPPGLPESAVGRIFVDAEGRTMMKPQGCEAFPVPVGPAQAAANLMLSLPIGGFLEPPGPTFFATTPIRDIEHTINRSNEGGFIVTDEGGTIVGVVTRMNFMTDSRFRLVLVDHNEFSQSVEGIEYASVEEIIDHHRIGLQRTNEPITVINRVVGSTCTIVASMYEQSGTDLDASTAGLLLSGLLSDTVILNSPTTTATDRAAALRLAQTAGVSLEAYGRELFAAGSEVESLGPEAILGQDRKLYGEKGRRFSVSQIEMVGFEAFWNRRGDLGAALEAFRLGQDLYLAALMVTDITTSTTLLLLSAPRAFRDRIAYPEPADGVYEMRGVLSRKKQVLPFLLELL